EARGARRAFEVDRERDAALAPGLGARVVERVLDEAVEKGGGDFPVAVDASLERDARALEGGLEVAPPLRCGNRQLARGHFRRAQLLERAAQALGDLRKLALQELPVAV